jgi:hypothetical protein
VGDLRGRLHPAERSIIVRQGRTKSDLDAGAARALRRRDTDDRGRAVG